MKFRIHFIKDEKEDFFDVEKSTLEEVKAAVDVVMSSKGLAANDCWSEKTD